MKYSLICDQEHNFEAWFSDYDTCEKQLKKSAVECPLCGSKKINKSIMAPNIPSKSNQKAPKSDVKKVEMVMNKIKTKETTPTIAKRPFQRSANLQYGCCKSIMMEKGLGRVASEQP